MCSGEEPAPVGAEHEQPRVEGLVDTTVESHVDRPGAVTPRRSAEGMSRDPTVIYSPQC